ncbi:MAG TPA: hypothetical protein VHD87_02150 [Acidimicrobiales bacterium]|nr:hypothetical protein [Acidimicrobiales bacterium]
MPQSKKRPAARPRGSKRKGGTGGRDAHTVGGQRYTPPARPAPRFRPRWHQAVGVLAIAAGAALFFTCETNIGNIHRVGGHVWYLVGVILAASSIWWFGAFDPPGSGFA